MSAQNAAESDQDRIESEKGHDRRDRDQDRPDYALHRPMPVDRLRRGRNRQTDVEQVPDRTASPTGIVARRRFAKAGRLISQRLINSNLVEYTVTREDRRRLYPTGNIHFFQNTSNPLVNGVGRNAHNARNFLRIFLLKDQPQLFDLRDRKKLGISVRIALHNFCNIGSANEIKLRRVIWAGAAKPKLLSLAIAE